MVEIIKKILVKGIKFNKKTGLCIFESQQDRFNWYSVSINNVEGKFYQGCLGKLFEYDNETLKVTIDKNNKKK